MASSSSYEARTRIFALGWAAAGLFDKLLWRHASGVPSNYVVLATAMVLFARPGSAIALLAFVSAQLVDWFAEPTVMANHLVVMNFAGASILVTAAWMLASGRFRGDDGPALVRTAAPALRVVLLLAYVLATLHKLNLYFLDPRTSCVALLLRDPMNQAFPLRFLPAAPERAVLAGIHATLLVESLIPLLLWTRRGRGAGIGLAVLFQSFLSSGPRNGFSAFAIVVFPLLALFASEACATRFVDAARGFVRRLASGPAGAFGPPLAALALLVVAANADQLGMYRLFPFWISLDLFVLAFLASEAARHRGDVGDPSPGFFDVDSAVLAIVPVLLLANGLSPYLGLKTETSLAMFSNLRTEGGVSNSLLVPADARIFRMQDDLVEVKETSVERLRPLVGRGLRVPFFHLRSLLTTHPDASIVFVRGGREVRIDRVDRHPDLLPPVPLWQRRLLPFRAVEAEGPQKCRH